MNIPFWYLFFNQERAMHSAKTPNWWESGEEQNFEIEILPLVKR